jgi:8-oxo-dGTP diphosphatase
MQAKPFGLAVKALVWDDSGRILFLRRASISKRFAGTWEPPGGKMDAGEAFDTALVREVAEETGLTIVLDRVAGATQYDMPGMKLAVLFLEARVLSGEVGLSDEHDEYRWIQLNEVLRLELTPTLHAFLTVYLQKVSH